MSAVGLRPLRVGEILDTGIKLYSRNARALMGISATVIVPLQLFLALVLISTYNDGNDISVGFSSVFSHTTLTQAETNARLGASAITLVASLLAGLLVTAACTKAVSDVYLDQPASVSASLRFAIRRAFPLLALLILYWLWLIAFFVLLIIPGVWLYTRLIAATPALLIEDLGPVGALKRSMRLVKGRWWPTAGAQFIYVLMVSMFGAVISGALTAIALTSDNPSVLAAVGIQTVAGIVAGVVVQPLTACFVTVIYYDLRVRQEGFDLELLARQLGLPEGSVGTGLLDAEFTPLIGPES
jgi:hypothetical protein